MTDFADATLTILRRWYWPVGLMLVALASALAALAARPAPTWRAEAIVRVPTGELFVALVQFQSPHVALAVGLTPGQTVSTERLEADYARVRLEAENAARATATLTELIAFVRERLATARQRRVARWEAADADLVRARRHAFRERLHAETARAPDLVATTASRLAEIDAALWALHKTREHPDDGLVLVDAPSARPIPRIPETSYALGAALLAGFVTGSAAALVQEWAARVRQLRPVVVRPAAPSC